MSRVGIELGGGGELMMWHKTQKQDCNGGMISPAGRGGVRGR